MHKSHARPGRPPKYGRAARAVTVTLPEDVLTRLSAVHADLGCAIVSLAERTAKRARRRPAPPAEVAPYGKRAVIVVNPARALKQLPGVELVPTGNGRALISLDPDYSIAHFELNLRDALEGNHVSGHERALLRDISGILHQARQSARTDVKARTIIVLEHKRRRKPV
jgi:hypothetical protein